MRKIVKVFHIPIKFVEKNLDAFVGEFFVCFSNYKDSARYIFDISETHWISNQNLLFLGAILKYLYSSGIEFKVKFLTNDPSKPLDIRVAKQFVHIWDIWKLYQITGKDDFTPYFDIEGTYIDRLKEQYDIGSLSQEVYEAFEITPLLILDKLHTYSDHSLNQMLTTMVKLDGATRELLLLHNCHTLFEKNIINYILLKELYENFLDHFTSSAFNTQNDFAFLSMTLNAKLVAGKKIQEQAIPGFAAKNFKEEYDDQYLPFFYDAKSEKFRNRSFLEISFIDFGEGIPNTLRAQFQSATVAEIGLSKNAEDSSIIRYAFKFDSSRHPLADKFRKNITIPRGLFDLLSIVKMSEGMIMIRSNYGKVLYDLSTDKDIKSSVILFEKYCGFFPGTMITIYIPERLHNKKIDASAIKPVYGVPKTIGQRKSEEFISLFKIQDQISSKKDQLNKEEWYNSLFTKLTATFHRKKMNVNYYIDFSGYDLDINITRKVIYFLISDYSINLTNNIFIINPPPFDFLEQMNQEIVMLTEVDRKFRIHPTPFIQVTEMGTEINIFWLGIYNRKDLKKLQFLQTPEHGLSKDDFESPEDIVGHVNYYDSSGNLLSLIHSEQLLDFFRRLKKSRRRKFSAQFFDASVLRDEGRVYLTPKNLYHTTYLNPLSAINNREMRLYFSEELNERLYEKVRSSDRLKYVTLSEPAKTIFQNLNIPVFPHIHLSVGENEIDRHLLADKFTSGDVLLIICETITTGRFLSGLIDSLTEIGVSVAYIACFTNMMDDTESNALTSKIHPANIISLYTQKTVKLTLNKLRRSLLDSTMEIIRINPFSGSPITSTAAKVFHKKNLVANFEFIDIIDQSQVKAGYFSFNHLIHPYFFDMDAVLKTRKTREKLLNLVFSRYSREHPNVLGRLSALFYPKDSGISYIDFTYLKDRIFKNQTMKIFELDRQSTKEGWRYSQIHNFSVEDYKEKAVFILDDGTCTGGSLIQMINEIALFDVSEIYVLTLISRLSEHQRELFLRMESIYGTSRSVKVKVVFGCHWHVPTYHFEETPITRERLWINELQSIQNLLPGIKKLCDFLLKELSFRDTKESNNEYLLRSFAKENIIKDLILKKDEVGKLTSFGLCREDFVFFDEIIAHYSKRNESPNRYQLIELLCGVFLHEPYLYPDIKLLVPDVASKVEEFAVTLIWGNIWKPKSPKLDRSTLTYKWVYKNITHLFFIVFYDSMLFKFLKPEKLIQLIKECGKNEKDLDYILYNLMKYVPMNLEQSKSMKHGGKVRILIEQCIESTELPENIRRHLKRFRSFMVTLPYHKNDYETLLSTIKTNYSRLSDSKYHAESIIGQYDICMSQINSYIGTGKKDNLANINRAWEKIADFVEQLLHFSRLFPSYFEPVKDTLYLSLEGSERTLRGKIDQVWELLHSINQKDAVVLAQLVSSIYRDFIETSSECCKIFQKVTTPNLNKLVNEFRKKLPPGVKVVPLGKPRQPITPVAVPEYYVEEVAFAEILGNFRNCDITKPVYLTWDETATSVKITLKNSIAPNVVRDGGGLGSQRLKALKEIPNEVCFYIGHKSGDLFFLQSLTFKKL
ncbi:MAG: phosphoribosyltransferase [Bacteroidota bacterium]